jgi:tellurite resistance protein TerC
MVTTLNGKRHITPLAIALVAIASADILFAVDSIPAIFGLTEETYLVFTANAFALLGLRQLFFLIDGLLDRLVYLSYGLASSSASSASSCSSTRCTRTSCRSSTAVST